MNYTIKRLSLMAGLMGVLLSSHARAGEFVVDRAKSNISVDVKASVHDFTGHLKDYKVKITGNAAKATPDKVALSWNFKDFVTGDKKRDKEMLHWLEHAKLPSGGFTLASFTKRVDGKMWAKGTLKIHGVSKTIEFPVTSVRKGKTLTVSGAVKLDHQDYKLKKIRKVLVLTVNPVVTVRFSLQGTIK